MAAFRIADVVDEPAFGLLPPCADPSFDHRSCDYWEDADRGSRLARSIAPGTPRPPARPPNPFAGDNAEEPSVNPFLPADRGPAFNPFAADTDEIVATVTKLRHEPGGDVLVNGSAQVIEVLRANDLVDEYRLMVFPIVLGAGKRMFAGDGDASALRLMDAKPAGETLILVYEPKDEQ